MAIVKRFNVNKEQATLDAEIIENMSANDVSYNASAQYDENTVGDKLSELEYEKCNVVGEGFYFDKDMVYHDSVNWTSFTVIGIEGRKNVRFKTFKSSVVSDTIKALMFFSDESVLDSNTLLNADTSDFSTYNSGTEYVVEIPGGAKALILSSRVGDGTPELAISVSADKRIYALEKSVNMIESNIEYEKIFKGKTISIVGDSISTFAGYVGDNRTYYPYSSITKVEQTWWYKLIIQLGGILKENNSFSGARVTNTHETYPSLCSKVAEIQDCDILFLSGGVNDNYIPSSELKLGVNFEASLSELDESAFGEAYDKYIRIGKSKAKQVFAIITSTIAEHLKNVIYEVCTYHKVKVIDITKIANIMTYMSSPHPDENGMALMKECCFRNILPCSLDDNYEDKAINPLLDIEWENSGLNKQGILVPGRLDRAISGFIELQCVTGISVNSNIVTTSAAIYDHDRKLIKYYTWQKGQWDINEFKKHKAKYIVLCCAVKNRYGNPSNEHIHISDTDRFVSVRGNTEFLNIYDSVDNFDKNIEDLKTLFVLNDGEIAEKTYIKDTQIATMSASWSSWKFYPSNKWKNVKVKAHCWGNSTDVYAISFFSSERLSLDNLMGGVFTKDGESDFEADMPDGCKMIIVSSRIASGSNQSASIFGNVSFVKLEKEISELRNKTDVVTYDSIGKAEFWLDCGIYSDMTWVGNRLIGINAQAGNVQNYNEEAASTIEINVYDNGIEKPKTAKFTLRHKWGHCNTIDYCAETDCLILGNGSGSYMLTGDVIIIPNFSTIVNVNESSSIEMTLESVGALVIHCDSSLGTKFNLVWGDDNDKNYNIAYLITANYGGSTIADGGDIEKIRKIVLCKGDSIGEYGVITTNDTPFNGTFNIVETYTQSTEGYPNCDQGTCYHNGKLYACIGHEGAWIWKMRLSGGKVIRESYKQTSYYQDKPTNFGNATGICFKDGYIFFGRASVGTMAFRP